MSMSTIISIMLLYIVDIIENIREQHIYVDGYILEHYTTNE